MHTCIMTKRKIETYLDTSPPNHHSGWCVPHFPNKYPTYDGEGGGGGGEKIKQSNTLNNATHTHSHKRIGQGYRNSSPNCGRNAKTRHAAVLAVFNSSLKKFALVSLFSARSGVDCI